MPLSIVESNAWDTRLYQNVGLSIQYSREIKVQFNLCMLTAPFPSGSLLLFVKEALSKYQVDSAPARRGFVYLVCFLFFLQI